jgi:hypothetical protein
MASTPYFSDRTAKPANGAARGGAAEAATAPAPVLKGETMRKGLGLPMRMEDVAKWVSIAPYEAENRSSQPHIECRVWEVKQ